MLKYTLENRDTLGFNPVFKAEAGLVLTGSEVKALKRGSGQLEGSRLKFLGEEPHLIGFKVGRYRFSSDKSFDTERDKKILLSKAEINKIFGLISKKGMVCLPAQVYNKGGFLKVELLVGRVSHKWEKKGKIKKDEQARQGEEYF